MAAVLDPAAATAPGTATAGWLARDEVALAGVLGRITDVVAVRGEGSWLVDVDGRRTLDFASGIAVTNVGHCHPRVVAAIAEQAATLVHTSVTAHHTRSVELAERLRALVPYLDDPQVFFCNTGAEAVDGTLKLARRATGKPGIVAFRRAFHGRTLAATSLTTAKGKYREGYEPLLPSVAIAPYCDPSRTTAAEALAAFDEVLALQSPGANVGVVLVEPVLGEGGYVVPPVAWLEGLRERCDRHGILLAFDEVQCGAGRTGRFFAAETFGVTPDVILFAKGIASGLPLGGILAPRALMERWPTGAHGSTFGGNPVSCAAALATLDVLEDEALLARCQVLGARIVDELCAATAGSTVVREVRGLGLMVGVELSSADVCARVQARCLADGLLVLTCGPGEDVLRLIPPLTLTDGELTHGLAILTSALAAEA
ncbi:MAG: aminotransferase class III-fold pyridoxal phosphate-dependent enzyme [Actinomycetota bacterium]|nr:aminotransferase class III-fold pyridoxal phosphate-dependent enzyme [Actinomycetota bacterium]